MSYPQVMSSLLLTTPEPTAGTKRDAAAKPLVLVVDDHADTRELLRYVIEMSGCNVVEAADGEEAVWLAEKMLPDLILMDTSLPRVDGLMATERIRKLDSIHKVGIIFLSARTEAHFRESAIAAGGDDFFVKPINLADLEIAVKRQLVMVRTANAFFTTSS